MKILLALLLTFSFNAQASEAEQPLTGPEKQAILKVIQKTCLDTWCEGSYDFIFEDMDGLVGVAGYAIYFRMRSSESNPWVETSCYFKGRASFWDYIASNGTNATQLKADFQDDLNQCIAHREDELAEIYPIKPSKSGTKEICVSKKCKKN